MSLAAVLPSWLVAACALVWAAVLRRGAARRAALVARAAHELRGPLAAARLALHGAGRERDRERGPGAAWPRGYQDRWLDAIAVELDRTDRALEDLEPAAQSPAPVVPVRALIARGRALSSWAGGARGPRAGDLPAAGRGPAGAPREAGLGGTAALRARAGTASREAGGGGGSAARARAGAQPVDVAALLRAQGAPWAAAAPSVGRRVRLAVPAGPLTVRGDRARLAQAVGNLIANAMEHGRGTVTLSAATAAAFVRIEVADEGLGLAAPVERLLVSDRLSRRRRGHGLAVAAEVAAAHGGRLVTAPSRSGARLALELPAAPGLQALPEVS
jgi:signal transduction histidine kinase